MTIFSVKRSVNIEKRTLLRTIYLFNKFKLFKFRKKLGRKKARFNVSALSSMQDINRIYLNDADNLLTAELLKLDGFDYHANGGNLGDFLIAQSEYKLFEELKLKYRIYKRADKTPLQANLVIGGGGGFVSYWNYQALFPLLNDKNVKNILILPSSFFNCDDFVNIIDNRFTIFCREKHSYDYLIKKNTGAKIYMAHDMATLLTIDNLAQNLLAVNADKIVSEQSFVDNVYKQMFIYYRLIYDNLRKSLKKIKANKNGLKVGYFLRNDKECLLNWKQYNINSTVDISTCAYGTCEDESMTNILTKMFLSAIEKVDVVVTDRLHVGVAGLLLNKKVYWGDNSYKKITGVYDFSYKNNPDAKIIMPENLQKELKNLVVAKTANDTEFNKMDLSFNDFCLAYCKNYKKQPVANIITGIEYD
ncbi:MAG: polysaccharide pyruvyl transferase family protein [Alphaproteobacteria bacterium]|nr:polysaccharide pyruvyl transferase family protein [Alphaproteobacteria bacterium]